MEKLDIPSTSTFMRILLQDGLLLFSGKSIVEDPIRHFKPVFDWIENYKPVSTSTVVNFEIEYLNSTSSKCILEVIIALDKLFQEGHSVKFNWKYEDGDDDMFDTGQHLKLNVKAPFLLIPN
jgi:hypothetical protein